MMAAAINALLALAVLVATPATPAREAARPETAPAGTPDTRYCMRIYAGTGSLIEQVRCWTRAKWARRGVDVDKDWRKEGARVKK